MQKLTVGIYERAENAVPGSTSQSLKKKKKKEQNSNLIETNVPQNHPFQYMTTRTTAVLLEKYFIGSGRKL